ncbi:MAG: hypothetical protein ACREA3_09085 [Nitrosotalea sp.]
MAIYDLFFQYQVRGMITGIEVTIDKKLHHLSALALSAYTEVMGGLVTGNLKKKGYSRKNYEAFLPYLGDKYVDLNNQLKSRKTSLHEMVRNKLVHEFSPRPSYGIFISESEQEKIGIEVNFDQNQIPILIIGVREYYRDFKNGTEKYYDDLEISASQPPFSEGHILFDNFCNAVVDRSAVEQASKSQ